ncbi:hypothetical protein [Thiorhodococcus minor]|uniref:Uncharacterized protein n=1 Tax=Thiorhodococcus minor TaxID=57489 RepID=A0A6M0K4J5_9GAMM|nr:hypothetical protein [Thiorhodococcus minor]NEV64682.1 hypothetical protein [Thiorhodococcus minor]
MKSEDSRFLDVLYGVCDALCEGRAREFARDNGVTRFKRDEENTFLVDGPFVAISLGVPSVRISLLGMTDKDGKPLVAGQDAIAALSGRLINLDYEAVKRKVFPD